VSRIGQQAQHRHRDRQIEHTVPERQSFDPTLDESRGAYAVRDRFAEWLPAALRGRYRSPSQSSARRQRSGEYAITAPEVEYVVVRNRSHQIENQPLFEGLGHPAERRRPPPRIACRPGAFNERGLHDALDVGLAG
jgi:hypothetical protein